jgi:hypothetical protein
MENNQDLVSRIFEMDREIWNELPDPDDCEWTDAGMFAPVNNHLNTLWRDASFQLKGEEEEWSFSYSTDGEIKGDIPPRYRTGVMTVLERYRRTPAMIEVSNVPADIK